MGDKKHYSDEIRESVLSQLAEGKSLRTICKAEGFPAPSTVIFWTLDDPKFAERYARVRRVGFEVLAEQLLDIADDGSNDYTQTVDGVRVNNDHINRSRLRVDTRKWILAKMLPKVYGEKLAVEASGPDGGALQVAVTHTVVDPSAS